MEVIEQIHTAPAIYMATAVEVVRRKAFSNHYLSRTASLAETFSSLHKEEITLRTNYQAKIKKHFLSKMFPGMDDYPPAFANDCPEKFDNRLPDITLADVEHLRQKVPDLANSLSVPESNALSNLLARSFNQKLTQEEGETLYSLQNLPGKIKIHSNDIGSVSIMNRLISAEHPTTSRKKFRKHPSVTGNSNDSETDTDADVDHRRQNGPTKRRDRNRKEENNLTRSLPLENSVLTLTHSLSVKQNDEKNTNISSNGVERSPNDVSEQTATAGINGRTGSVGNVDPHISSSSADPSSSSGGNTSISVAPSSSSDGSALMNSKLKVNGTGITADSAEKAATQMIASLNSRVTTTESKFNRLREDVKIVCLSEDEHSISTLTGIKQELAELKNKVLEDKEAYSFMIKKFSDVLYRQISNMENLRRNETDEMLRKQSKSDFEQAKNTLELEHNKLEDCHREIEIYRQQLEHSTREVDRMKSDAIEEKETFENRLKKEVEQKCTEKEEAVKKLMLEYELELESVRQELETSEKVLGYQQQIASFKSRLHENEKYVDDLRKKTRILEMTQEEKFQTEKEKIVQILEAGYAQREKLAIHQGFLFVVP
jgi:RB1-inducible coiled-coil protein 1